MPRTDRKHTDREYAAELQALREHVLLMGARVEELVSHAVEALERHDRALALATIDADRLVDQAELDIDEMCLRILARRHPVASDLRFITMTLKVVTDLERIGDLGVNICERVYEADPEPKLLVEATLVRMANIAQSMLRDALDALVDGDVARARTVVERDSQVDVRYAQLFPELVTLMMEDSDTVRQAMRMQAIGKYIERMADHAANLAEMVIFMVAGRDVRHGQVP